MLALARATATRQSAALRSAGQRRMASTHTEKGWHIPFYYQNKSTLALKTIAYLGTGFSIPFVAAWYQLRKSA